jgi:hypothetical protein
MGNCGMVGDSGDQKCWRPRQRRYSDGGIPYLESPSRTSSKDLFARNKATVAVE